MKTRILLTGIAVIMIAASPDSANAFTVNVDEKSPSVQVALPNPPAFVSFRTHRFGRNGATAAWSIDNHNGITGFVLERTYEDPYDPYSVWEVASALPCGGNRNFRVNDSPLSPGFISYRVVMMNGASVVATSEISTIQIVQH